MKIRKSSTPGKVTLEIGDTDGSLLEQTQTSPRFRLNSVLVPVDFSSFSDKAVDYARAFATQFGAGVILLHVVEPVVYPENYTTLPAVTDDIHSSLLQGAELRLREQRRRFEDGPLVVRTLARLGRPFTEIVDVAREQKVDLIILATHGYTGLKHVLLGSTAERVVRHAPCPVLTVRDPEHDFVLPEAPSR